MTDNPPASTVSSIGSDSGFSAAGFTWQAGARHDAAGRGGARCGAGRASGPASGSAGWVGGWIRGRQRSGPAQLRAGLPPHGFGPTRGDDLARLARRAARNWRALAGAGRVGFDDACGGGNSARASVSERCAAGFFGAGGRRAFRGCRVLLRDRFARGLVLCFSEVPAVALVAAIEAVVPMAAGRRRGARTEQAGIGGFAFSVFLGFGGGKERLLIARMEAKIAATNFAAVFSWPSPETIRNASRARSRARIWVAMSRKSGVVKA